MMTWKAGQTWIPAAELVDEDSEAVKAELAIERQRVVQKE